MNFLRGEESLGNTALSMVDDIARVMQTQALTDAETAKLKSTLAEIVGNEALAEAYLTGSMDGEAESGYNERKLSNEDKTKLDKWEYRPDDNLYLKYKAVFDNSTYYDQETGEALYPGMRGDINTNGFVNGKSQPDVMKADSVYMRYGNNGNANYFADMGTPYAQLALPPGSDSKPLVEITVLKDIPCSSGDIVSWFDQPGGGKQYLTDVLVEDDSGNLVEATLKNLKKYKYINIRIIK